MLVDAHAHLDEVSMANFVKTLSENEPDFVVITNSVDAESSFRNLELAEKSARIIPFVGIHPESFLKIRNEGSIGDRMETSLEKVSKVSLRSAGIGEIGIDPKYGSEKDQESLFRSLLSSCEKTGLPVSIHSRNSVSKIIQILSTFNLRGSILFHWFAGSEQELDKLGENGIYVSYGPSIINSKRMRSLVYKSDLEFILAETDSPTPFNSLNEGIGTPFLVGSVVFEIGLIKKIRFEEMRDILNENVFRYLGTQTSLRVKSK
jgi:TatD DNase family protein